MKTSRGTRNSKSANSPKKNDELGGDSFEELVRLYGTNDPAQIQLRIMWIHIQNLVKAQFGGTEETVRTLRMYDERWKICERKISTSRTLNDVYGTKG
jgi:hypothetical protein